MADINIERRRKSPLPWIIGLLVLAVLAFMFLRGRGGGDVESTTVVTDTAAVTTTTTP